MSSVLIAGTLIVNLALVFYTLGIVSEQRSHRITRRVLIFLSVGVVFDLVATGCMVAGSPRGPFTAHGLLGYSSLTDFGHSATAPERTHPVTYVICSQDRAVPPEAQEQMAQQADDVVRLDSAHCPMFSMPGQLAAVLDAAAP